jgi:hypothetical protein
MYFKQSINMTMRVSDSVEDELMVREVARSRLGGFRLKVEPITICIKN